MRVGEVEGGKEVKEKNTRVAAFFDLDGTLLPLPSLEQKFFRILRYRNEIPRKNYFLWLREAMRLLSRGIRAIAHANKMYLKGVQILDQCDAGDRHDSSSGKSDPPSGLWTSQGDGQALAPPRRTPRWPVPRFFEEGVERVVCHAMLGHAVVIVSGTLEPLANNAARMLEAQLAARGFPARIRVCATRLEESQGRWTGKIMGEAMFGEAKARAVRRLATEMQWDLTQSWAYGDSSNDRWMLETVGKPIAMNPSLKLACFARICGWAILRWKEKEELAQRAQSPQRAQGKEREERTREPETRSLLRVIRERVPQMVRWT